MFDFINSNLQEKKKIIHEFINGTFEKNKNVNIKLHLREKLPLDWIIVEKKNWEKVSNKFDFIWLLKPFVK